MSEENCLIFIFHSFPELTCTQTFQHCEKMVRNFGTRYFECYHLWPGALVRWCMKPASLNYTLRKKKCSYLKGWIFVVLQVLKLLCIAREPWTILEHFFAYLYQEHWQTEIHYKVDLSTLFPKRNELAMLLFFWRRVYYRALVTMFSTSHCQWLFDTLGQT